MEDQLIDYIYKEYEVMKDAHFQTSQSITTFFQYAILIFSAPLVLLTESSINSGLLGSVFLVISLVGISIMLYLSQLRAEALLYARNINKLRNGIYTYAFADTSQEKIHSIRVMMSQDKKPKYTNWHQFGFIILALGLLDSFYMGYGTYNIILCSDYYCEWIDENTLIVSLFIAVFWMCVHFILHFALSQKSENGTNYFKQIIGVDIDGVLNDHESQFVLINNEINKTKIKSSDITTLPVHKSGIISKKEEHDVFAQEKYWVDMPFLDDVLPNLIEEIRNKMGYKIYLFTWRDWIVLNSKKRKLIEKITKEWLKKNKIKYDKIFPAFIFYLPFS